MPVMQPTDCYEANMGDIFGGFILGQVGELFAR